MAGVGGSGGREMETTVLERELKIERKTEGRFCQAAAGPIHSEVVRVRRAMRAANGKVSYKTSLYIVTQSAYAFGFHPIMPQKYTI